MKFIPYLVGLIVFFLGAPSEPIPFHVNNSRQHQTGEPDTLRIIYSDPAEELNSRGVDTSDVAGVRRLIDSPQAYLASRSSLFLAQRGYTEIDSAVHARYYRSLQEPISFSAHYLYALLLINDTSAHQMIYDFIDTLIVHRAQHYGTRMPSEVIDAMKLLLMVHDYSRYSVYTSFIDDPVNGHFDLNLKTLTAFGQDSTLRDSVFNRLATLATTGAVDDRDLALSYLVKFSDLPEARLFLQNLCTSDSSTVIRVSAADYLIRVYHDISGMFALKHVAQATTDTSVFDHTLTGIVYFRSPYAIQCLKDILAVVPAGYFSNEVAAELQYYSPPHPPEDEQIHTSLDTLISFKHQMASLNWISDSNFVSELDTNLIVARNYLTSGDSNNCARQIKLFQHKVDEEYRDSLDGDNKFVTLDSWKFLYFNAQYILDRLTAIKKED